MLQLCAERGWDGHLTGKSGSRNPSALSLLPGTLQGLGWGDFPLFGVFRGKEGERVGFSLRAQWEIVEKLEVMIFISFTAREQEARGSSPGREPRVLPSRACSGSPSAAFQSPQTIASDGASWAVLAQAGAGARAGVARAG